MISSLTNRGKLRFMIYEGALKAPIFRVPSMIDSLEVEVLYPA